jgi:hypothetical protein
MLSSWTIHAIGSIKSCLLHTMIASKAVRGWHLPWAQLAVMVEATSAMGNTIKYIVEDALVRARADIVQGSNVIEAGWKDNVGVPAECKEWRSNVDWWPEASVSHNGGRRVRVHRL